MAKHCVGVIIQARMGSTRLPGKILLELDENEKVIDVLIKRLKFCNFLDYIIIATTPDEKNSAIIDVAKQFNVSFFVGNEEDVLERYYLAAKKFHLDIIIRVTSDCPFVDPTIMDEMIKFYTKNKYNYIKNFDEKTQYTRGFEIEILNFKTLKTVYSQAKSKPEREHVTFYIYKHPELFTVYNFHAEYLNKYESLRLTIDEKDDLLFCREIYKKIKEKKKPMNFTIFDIYDTINENPELININKNIIQKKYT